MLAPVAPARKSRATNTARPGVRALAAQATKDAILRAAVKVFARHGYAGGRVEQISRAAKSYDRMIYYYFGSKQGLYVAALEDIYRRFDEAEGALEIDETRPAEALKAMIRFIWDYYQAHPEFIALLNTENMHRGRHIARASRTSREAPYASPALAVTDRILKAGARAGMFRRGLAARDVYLMIAALGYFYLSNRYTLSAFLGEPLDRPDKLAHWEAFIIDAVQRTVSA